MDKNGIKETSIDPSVTLQNANNPNSPSVNTNAPNDGPTATVKDIHSQAVVELATARSELVAKRRAAILQNLGKERSCLFRQRRRVLKSAASDPFKSLNAIQPARQHQKLKKAITPPPGIQWVRAKTNVRLPDGYEPSFFIPYLDENEENLLQSSVVADELYESESDVDDDSDIDEHSGSCRGHRRVTPSGKRKVANFIWERAAKRLAMHRLILRFDNSQPQHFSDAVGKAFNFNRSTSVEHYIKIVTQRDEVWTKIHKDKVQTTAIKKKVLKLVQGQATVTAAEALRGDSIPYFFCRRCYIFNCHLHGLFTGGPTCKIPDRSRKDSTSRPVAMEIESKCADSPGKKCWYNRDEFGNTDPLSIWWKELQDSSAQLTEDIRLLLKELLPTYGDDFCRVSEIVRIMLRDFHDFKVVTCERMGYISRLLFPNLLGKVEFARMTARKFGTRNPSVESKAINEGKRPDYSPCQHDGPCTAKNCTCVKAGVHCEKYCGCNHNRPNQPRNMPPCPWSFKGCSCKSSIACVSNACVCFSWKRECDPDLCKSCHDCKPTQTSFDRMSCRNVGLQHGKGHRTVAGKSDVHGWGLFSTGDIAKNELVGEYVGEVIEDQDAERRGRVYDLVNSNFLFDMTTKYSLDSSRLGNKLRYCNHSSSPNCEARLMRVNGDIRVGIFARSDIHRHEELLFHYGPVFVKKLMKQARRNKKGNKGKPRRTRSGDDAPDEDESSSDNEDIEIEAKKEVDVKVKIEKDEDHKPSNGIVSKTRRRSANGRFTHKTDQNQSVRALNLHNKTMRVVKQENDSDSGGENGKVNGRVSNWWRDGANSSVGNDGERRASHGDVAAGPSSAVPRNSRRRSTIAVMNPLRKNSNEQQNGSNGRCKGEADGRSHDGSNRDDEDDDLDNGMNDEIQPVPDRVRNSLPGPSTSYRRDMENGETHQPSTGNNKQLSTASKPPSRPVRNFEKVTRANAPDDTEKVAKDENVRSDNPVQSIRARILSDENDHINGQRGAIDRSSTPTTLSNQMEEQRDDKNVPRKPMLPKMSKTNVQGNLLRRLKPATARGLQQLSDETTKADKPTTSREGRGTTIRDNNQSPPSSFFPNERLIQTERETPSISEHFSTASTIQLPKKPTVRATPLSQSSSKTEPLNTTMRTILDKTSTQGPSSSSNVTLHKPIRRHSSSGSLSNPGSNDVGGSSNNHAAGRPTPRLNYSRQSLPARSSEINVPFEAITIESQRAAMSGRNPKNGIVQTPSPPTASSTRCEIIIINDDSTQEEQATNVKPVTSTTESASASAPASASAAVRFIGKRRKSDISADETAGHETDIRRPAKRAKRTPVPTNDSSNNTNTNTNTNNVQGSNDPEVVIVEKDDEIHDVLDITRPQANVGLYTDQTLGRGHSGAHDVSNRNHNRNSTRTSASHRHHSHVILNPR